MRKLNRILSLCMALMICLSASVVALPELDADVSAAQGTNLIENPSFESGSNFSTGSLYRSTDKAHTGSYSLKCSARGVTVCVSTYSNISVKKNTDYLFSGYIYRADNSTWGYIDMNDRTGELQLLNTDVYGEWVYVSGVWNSGDSASVQPRIVIEPNYTINQHLGAGITGDVWFDDITLAEITYDSYSETPPSLSASAKGYTMENEDISVTVETENNKEYLTALINKETGHNWINKAAQLPLTTVYEGGEISWTLKSSDLDNKITLQGTGKDACHTLTLTYSGSVSGLTLKSYYKIYPTGPLYHYTEMINNTGRTVSFPAEDLIPADVQLLSPSDTTVYRFNRSRFNNGFDGLFTTGVLTDKVGTNSFIKSVVENSWLLSSGSLPYNVIQGSNQGLYLGYEWSYGEMLLRTQNDSKKIRFSATLGTATDDTIERKSGETLLIPPVFIGAYEGDVDDGSNQMKEWFFNHLMTESLRENENEPLIELHLPLFAESDLKGYLYDCDLEDWGVELTKMDYWWTVPSNSEFDAYLEQQWNPNSSKWPSGMTYGHLVKASYPTVKTSLYMADTYQGVDIGTDEGRELQLNALKTRLENWNIDYWRSDFDVLKPNNYENHEGLMYILDSLIEWDDDFRYEHCSAGGSLKDFSTLQRMTFMTMEDSGGALNHRMAFYSNSYMINPVQLKFDMGFDWRPSDSNEQNLINSNQSEWITYNVRTAMMGAMMVQNVSNRLNSQELSALKEGWSLYKEKQRSILRGADVYHILPMPTGTDWDGMEYYNEDIEQGSVFLFRDKSGPTSKTIKLDGLDENGTYKLTFEDRTDLNSTKSGKELMSTGITVTGMSSAYDSEIIWIERVDEAPTSPTTPTAPTTPTESDTEPTTAHTEPTTAGTDPTETTAPYTTEPTPTPGPVPGPVPGPDSFVILGDSDLSRKVNIKDATLVQKHVAALGTLQDKALYAADADQNNTVNIKDATAIQKYVASLETGYPIGESVYYRPSLDIIDPTTAPTEQTKATEPTEATKQTDITTPTATESEYIDLTQLDGQVIVMSNNSFSSPYAYFWSDNSTSFTTWPGVAMESVGELCYIIIPRDATKIIFSNLGSDQGTDLTIPGNFAIYNASTGDWEGYLSDYVDVTRFPADILDLSPTDPPKPTDPAIPIAPSSDYVYFDNSTGWSEVYCYYWSDSDGAEHQWPGVRMEEISDGIYGYEISRKYDKIVFNNGSGTQTADLEIHYDAIFDSLLNDWANIYY